MASHERYKLLFLVRYLGTLILILSIESVISKTQKHHTCVAGVSTPGYTYPVGDITLKYGDSLDILCILHESKAAEYGPNASSYMTITWGGKVQATDIVNSTAIQLHIDKHPLTKRTNYACSVNGTFVCQNVVAVGTKPKVVTDFKCIGYNYENLTCSWTAPENNIKTDYYLESIPSARPARFAARCPNITYKDDDINHLSCTWSFSTTPQYRHSHEFFKFLLKANNTFGIETWEFPFEHYPHVIPNAPENLTGHSTSPHSIMLRWVVPVHMQSFPGGIDHRIMWWIEGSKDWVTLPIIKDEKIKHKVMEYELENLPYAHCLYDIRVSMRSSKATDENFWSQNSSYTVWTDSKLPNRPPRTNIGSFEMQESGNRIVYWQNINEREQNGQNFSYRIEVVDHPGITYKKKTLNYAIFENLTDHHYIFNIWSENDLGTSIDYSTVFMPASAKALKPPSKLIKVDRDHGVYDLEWPLNDDPRVINYTLFWCPAPIDRPYQCDGTLNWTTVSQGNKNITLRLADLKNKITGRNTYQFAISADGYQTSSGMIWAECTILPDRGYKISQTYVKNVGPRFITVVWKLECVKMSDVLGFIVTYCPLVSSPHSKDCKNNSSQSKFIEEPNAGEGVIDNLTPYTRYKIEVKPSLRSAVSQFSEPMFNSTHEDKPSNPRNLRVINKSASSILIQWEKPEHENGILRLYEVLVNGEMKKKINVVNQTVYEVNLTNLTYSTVYNIQVRVCSLECSEAHILNETEVGRPGAIPSRPAANWDNYSLVIRWDKPEPKNLKVDYYEVLIGMNNEEEKVFNVTDLKYEVGCGKNKSQNIYVRVRAINVFAGKLLFGPWSERADFRCFESTSTATWVVIIIVASVVVFMVLIAYLIKLIWYKLLPMRKLNVELPVGLQDAIKRLEEKEKNMDDTLPADEPLLSKKFPSQHKNRSGESSGCCSGTESVSSSVESAGHLSISDSGTEQPKSPSLGDNEVALRQRNTKPTTKKSDYVTVPEITAAWSPKPAQSGYSVIGLAAPPKKPEAQPEYMTLAEIPAKSSYVPFLVPQVQEPIKEPSVRPPPSGYMPYMTQEPAAKNTDYVLAGVPTKQSIVLPKIPPFTQKEGNSSGYVTAPPMTMEAPKLLIPWQQQSPVVETPSTGYVVVGDPKPQKTALELQKGSKGYIPHNLNLPTKSLKED